MPVELNNLVKERKAIRTAVTKITTKLENLIKSDNANDVEEQLEQLKVKSCNLKALDNKIKETVEAAQFEEEIESELEYEDKIVKWQFKATKFLKEKRIMIDPSVSNVPSQNDSKFVDNGQLRLPKIMINKFYGNIREWQTFYNSFDTAIHQNQNLSKIDKFNYLVSLLGGSALRIVEGFSLSNRNYEEALKLLKDRFGRKDMLINTHMNILLNLQPVRSSNDLRALRRLYDTCNVQIRSLDSLEVKSDSFGNLLCPLLMKCIPRDIALDYSRKKNR